MKVRVAFTETFTDNELSLLAKGNGGVRPTRAVLRSMLEDIGTMGVEERVHEAEHCRSIGVTFGEVRRAAEGTKEGKG